MRVLAFGWMIWTKLGTWILDPVSSLQDSGERRTARLYAAVILVISSIGLTLGLWVFPMMQGDDDLTANATWRAGLVASFGFAIAYLLARLGRLVPASYAVVSVAVICSYLASLEEPQVLLFMNSGAVIASVVLPLRGAIVCALAVALGPLLLSAQVASIEYARLAYIQGVNILLPALLLLVGWYRDQLLMDRERRDARFVDLVRGSPDGILYVDLQGNVVTCNPAMEILSGRNSGELLGAPLSRLGLAAIVPTHAAIGERPRLHSVKLTCRDGSERSVECLVQPVDDPLLGRCAQIMVRDIQERQRAQEVQDRLEVQLHDARRLESIGRLAGGIAHDINNQLTVILGSAHLLLRKGGQDQDLLQAITMASEHSGNLIGQLLTFARGQEQAVERIDVNQNLLEFQPVLRTLVRDDVELSLSLCESDARVLIDPTQLEQVVINLAANASDAMPGGGTLRLSTTVENIEGVAHADAARVAPGHYVAIQVQDEGSGIDDVTMRKMFEPFYTTKAVGEGTGLGLATVYGVVQQSGGVVYATSTLGQGTTFRVLLPWVKDSAIDAVEVPGEPRIDWALLKVLIVDDQKLVGELVARVLTGLGCATLYAQSSAQAQQLFEDSATEIDLLISDVIMPDLSGPKLVERLRAIRPSLRVLLTSGYPYREDLSGEVVLSKPFTPEELIAAIGRVV